MNAAVHGVALGAADPAAPAPGSAASRSLGARPVRASRGPTLKARSWLTEVLLCMLMNTLDPEVAENPDELVVNGGISRAARDWAAFVAIVATLRRLGGRRAALARAVERPGHRRDTSCRRRLRGGHRVRAPAGPGPADECAWGCEPITTGDGRGRGRARVRG